MFLLPADLKAAESMVLEALQISIKDQPKGRWEVKLKFEGLKLMPLALRLSKNLQETELFPLLVWPDAGGAALARKNAPDLADQISSINELLAKDPEEYAEKDLLVVGPQPSDYDIFEQLSNKHLGALVMLNGRLEDAAIGIGSVARERRRRFVDRWRKAFWLEPLESGSLMRVHPEYWQLFRLDPDGYRQVETYEQRPEAEEIESGLDS